MKNKETIAITGIGPLTAGGSGKEAVWNAIEKRKTGLKQKEYKLDGESLGKFYVHKIEDFNIDNYGLDRRALNEVKSWKEGEEIEDLYYFLATIKMAIDDAGLKIDERNRDTTGLVLAHENIGFDHFYWKVVNSLDYRMGESVKRKSFFDDFYKKFQRTGYELQTFMPLFHIAKIFDIHGYSLFLNNACASGLFALEAAADAIRSGKCEQMVVAAVDNSSVFKHVWFNNINMCAKDGKIKPFASDRDGFTIGDGGAALVLEGLESARKRKANVYAEYAGGGFVLEGWKVTYPDVANKLYEKAIHKALDSAKLKPSDIDLIVPHGAATTITDKHEAKTIREVFGKKPVVTALKPYTGHTLGSTALLETAIMLIGLKNKKIPPTVNCENIDDTLGINVLRSMKDADDIKIAMRAACGFAGYNAACVYRVT